jgi:hypothetical protein
MRKREEEGWTALETLAALFIALVASGALASAAWTAVKAGRGLAERVGVSIEAANGVSDAIMALYAL